MRALVCKQPHLHSMLSVFQIFVNLVDEKEHLCVVFFFFKIYFIIYLFIYLFI